MNMNLDQLQQFILNGFAQMREPHADIDDQIKTLEVMSSVLKHRAKQLKDNKTVQVELNTLS
jgi:hypothetical protein